MKFLCLFWHGRKGASHTARKVPLISSHCGSNTDVHSGENFNMDHLVRWFAHYKMVIFHNCNYVSLPGGRIYPRIHDCPHDPYVCIHPMYLCMYLNYLCTSISLILSHQIPIPLYRCQGGIGKLNRCIPQLEVALGNLKMAFGNWTIVLGNWTVWYLETGRWYSN